MCKLCTFTSLQGMLKPELHTLKCGGIERYIATIFKHNERTPEGHISV